MPYLMSRPSGTKTEISLCKRFLIQITEILLTIYENLSQAIFHYQCY